MISIKEYVDLQKEQLKKFVSKAHRSYKLDIFQVGDNSASNSYIKGKMKDCDEIGIKCELHKYETPKHNDNRILDEYNQWVTQEHIKEDATEAIVKGSCGIILQLPMPPAINTQEIIRDSCKCHRAADVDGFYYDVNNPCTPRGIIDWLEYNNIILEGKNVVVIGRSDIVGKPMARLLTEKNATVTLCHSHTDEMALYDYCSIADIIICAVGKPKFLKLYSFFAENTIIVDVGINRDENGKLCGDVDSKNWEEIPGCYVTPVPGGVGLLTRLRLLKNVVYDFEGAYELFNR